MSEQIVKVETDPRDEGCIQITLRHLPRKFQFWRQHEPKLVVYKGYGDNWYRLPSFTPAPPRVVPLLKAITYSPQYKHLRYNI